MLDRKSLSKILLIGMTLPIIALALIVPYLKGWDNHLKKLAEYKLTLKNEGEKKYNILNGDILGSDCEKLIESIGNPTFTAYDGERPSVGKAGSIELHFLYINNYNGHKSTVTRKIFLIEHENNKVTKKSESPPDGKVVKFSHPNIWDSYKSGLLSFF